MGPSTDSMVPNGHNEGSLAQLVPTSAAYATMPVARAFAWRAWAGEAEAGEWYLVVFRSVLRPSADEARLWEQDRLAFDEAAASPGFVHYFRGLPNERRECLSFCLWKSRAQARAAARRPAHLEAVGLIDEMYERYVLELLHVRKHRGESELEFEPLSRIEVR